MHATPGAVALLLGLLAGPASGAPAHTQSDSKLGQQEQEEVVHSLQRVLAENYVFGDLARAIGLTLERDLEAGAYQALDDPRTFATRLTRDLYDASGDLHFLVAVDPEWVTNQDEGRDPERKLQLERRELEQTLRDNSGFREVRHLEGNVGYLRFSYFAEPQQVHDTLATAMEFLSHSDALIIDLRTNNGGHLEMGQMLISYFLTNEKPIRLTEFYDQQGGERIEGQHWVLPCVTGKRMIDVPLYVLTSNSTFSAAEWFAYILQNLGRATVIGETTAGGAHPVNRLALNERFVVNVPTGKVSDATTGGDFEGTGVEPDIEVPAAEAFHRAHREALERLTALRPNERDTYAWFLPVVEARAHPARPARKALESLVGHYGHREVLIEDDVLYYSWDGKGRLRMIPLSDTLLGLEGIDDFRFQAVRDGEAITGLLRIYQDGSTLLHPRTR